MKVLSAGFILSSIRTLLDKDHEAKLLTSLCNFSLQTSFPENDVQVNYEDEQLCAMLHNYISRGCPTTASLTLERELNRLFSEEIGIKDKSNNSEYIFEINDAFKQLFIKSLSIIDPRISNLKRPRTDFNGSEPAQRLYNFWPEYLKQIVLPEREFKDGIIIGDENQFFRQRVDFALETLAGCKWILEVDGKQHQQVEQQLRDSLRDFALKGNDWRIKRIAASVVNEHRKILQEFYDVIEQDQYINIIRNNFDNPLWLQENGISALNLTLTPFAVARIQKTLVYLIQQGILSLTQPEWKIAIIEQDVSCAALALVDFFRLLENFYLLLGRKKKFPNVYLTIFQSPEFKSDNSFESASENVVWENKLIGKDTSD